MNFLSHILTFSFSAFALLACSTVKEYKLEVVAEYPHDITSYTQGLFFDGGRMYESTGMRGESTLRVVDLPTGEALQRVDFAREYFAEGSVVFKDSLYVLTWQNKTAFIYEKDSLKLSSAWSYPREGWGITTDGEFLIASDGSSKLYFMDEHFSLKKKIFVKKDGKPVRWLNELEYIDGKIWANVYMTDTIVIINPRDGKVEATVDCKGLLPDKYRTRRTDVLNGIAYNPDDGKIYLTGKYWSRLYEIKLVRK